MDYNYKTQPFKHQEELFLRTRDTESYGIFWEQGCGKTKPTIDTTAYLFLKDEIDALLVVAPNGVHRNWITDEIPAHMPEEVVKQMKYHFYQSPKAKTKKHIEKCEELLKHKGLSVVTISYDGFMTESGKAFMKKFLRQRRCMYVLDEGHFIKSPSAKRTKAICSSGVLSKYRRLLTGTPISKGPFDLYSQIKFLSSDFWLDRRLPNFHIYKRFFGVWRTRQEVQNETGFDPGYDMLVDYKNVHLLEGYLKLIGHRLTKDEAGLDLPPKLYSKRYFEMTSAQNKAYEELVEEYTTELQDGTVIEAPLALVRLLRLQQITCGYISEEAGEPVKMISNKNPRLELLQEICEGLTHKAIIWARFTSDIDQIMHVLGDKAVRYDGRVTDDERAKSKEDFQTGDKQFFVGNPQAGSTGLTLHAARTVIYYSNSYKLIDRLQSEDRAHRIGQEHPVNYIDIVTQQKTVDNAIVKSLRSKFDIATQITGDKLKEWL